MKANQATHSVRVMCRLLKVSPSGFYAWDGRAMSARERSDIALTARIQEIYRRSDGTYGSPNIHAELADDHGIHVGKKRVARLSMWRMSQRSGICRSLFSMRGGTRAVNRQPSSAFCELPLAHLSLKLLRLRQVSCIGLRNGETLSIRRHPGCRMKHR